MTDIGMFGGIRIVTDGNLVIRTEDWSRVRSPSRAKRRLKRGFSQNIMYRVKPDTKAYTLDGGKTYIMHPEAFEALKIAAATEVLPPEKPKEAPKNPIHEWSSSLWITPRLVPMKKHNLSFFNSNVC